MNANPGDLKIQRDPPDYPPEWDTQQRLTAYWAAINVGFPNTTAGWYALLNQAHRHHDHIADVLAQEQLDYAGQVDYSQPAHESPAGPTPQTHPDTLR